MELADVPDSKSGPGDRVRVRPPPPAPKSRNFYRKGKVPFFYLIFIFISTIMNKMCIIFFNSLRFYVIIFERETIL